MVRACDHLITYTCKFYFIKIFLSLSGQFSIFCPLALKINRRILSSALSQGRK